MTQDWFGASEAWKKDVQSHGAPKETRKEFYGNKAIRKVGGSILGEDVVKDLDPDDIAKKLKEQAEITKDAVILEKKWDPETVTGGRTLSKILAEFFEKKCSSTKSTADALIALKYLNAELDGVDSVYAGETVEIENGLLTIKKDGEVVGRGAILERTALAAGAPEKLSRAVLISRKAAAAGAALRAEVEGAGSAGGSASRRRTARPAAAPRARPTRNARGKLAPEPPLSSRTPAGAAPTPGPKPEAGDAGAAATADRGPAPGPGDAGRPAAGAPGPGGGPTAAPPTAGRGPVARLAPGPTVAEAAAEAALNKRKDEIIGFDFIGVTAAESDDPKYDLVLKDDNDATAVVAYISIDRKDLNKTKIVNAAKKKPKWASSSYTDLMEMDKDIVNNILLPRTKEAVKKLKLPPGYKIKLEAGGEASITYTIINIKNKQQKANLMIAKVAPREVDVSLVRPVYKKYGKENPYETDTVIPLDYTDLQANIAGILTPDPDEINREASTILADLKKIPELKDIAHEIDLVPAASEWKGADRSLDYYKIVLQGTTGEPVDVGYIGFFKENPRYKVLLKLLDHELSIITDDNKDIVTLAARDLTWGGVSFVPAALPAPGDGPPPPAETAPTDEAQPPAPAGAPPQPELAPGGGATTAPEEEPPPGEAPAAVAEEALPQALPVSREKYLSLARDVESGSMTTDLEAVKKYLTDYDEAKIADLIIMPENGKVGYKDPVTKEVFAVISQEDFYKILVIRHAQGKTRDHLNIRSVYFSDISYDIENVGSKAQNLALLEQKIPANKLKWDSAGNPFYIYKGEHELVVTHNIYYIREGDLNLPEQSIDDFQYIERQLNAYLKFINDPIYKDLSKAGQKAFAWHIKNGYDIQRTERLDLYDDSSENKITNEDLKIIAGLGQLRVLYLEKALEVTDISPLGEYSSLNYVQLNTAKTAKISSQQIQDLYRVKPGIIIADENGKTIPFEDFESLDMQMFSRAKESMRNKTHIQDFRRLVFMESSPSKMGYQSEYGLFPMRMDGSVIIQLEVDGHHFERTFYLIPGSNADEHLKAFMDEFKKDMEAQSDIFDNLKDHDGFTNFLALNERGRIEYIYKGNTYFLSPEPEQEGKIMIGLSRSINAFFKFDMEDDKVTADTLNAEIDKN